MIGNKTRLLIAALLVAALGCIWMERQRSAKASPRHHECCGEGACVNCECPDSCECQADCCKSGEAVALVQTQSPSDFSLDGLDPLEQRRMKDRIRVHQLEQEIGRLKRLVSVQIRQIAQLQRYTFGLNPRGIGDGPAIGSDGPAFGAEPQSDLTPIETPADLIPDEHGSDTEK